MLWNSVNEITNPSTFLSSYLSMLENSIIFGRERRNSCPGYLQGLPCDQAFSAPTQTPMWWLSAHSMSLQAQRLSARAYIYEPAGCPAPLVAATWKGVMDWKPLLTQTSEGRARLAARRWLPRVYRHLETAAVASTCEWVVMKGNEAQPEASWLPFYLPEILSVLVWPKCSL